MENENWLNSTTYRRRFCRNSDVSAYRFLDPFVWDPLYGKIVWGDDIETDPIYQACMVILCARELWGVYEFTYLQDLIEADKKDEADREQQRRQLARTIFNCYEPARSVVAEYVTRDDGQLFKKYTLCSKKEYAIDIVRGHLEYANREDETRESDILIMLAIAEAHDALCWIYLEERPEDEHAVLELIHDAEGLLALARSEQSLERKRKTLEQPRKKYHEGKAARDERLRQYAQEIRREFKDLAESHIPMTIIQRHPEFERKKGHKGGLSERRIAEIIAVKKSIRK